MSTKLKYPYAWGRNVVNTFVEKYVRGTYFLAKLLDISPGELRHNLVLLLCSGNSLKWEAVKRVVVALCEYEHDEIARFSPSERKLLYKCLYNLCIYSQLDGEEYGKVLDNVRTRSLF